MRVGLIAPPWVPVPPPAYGGTEAVVDNLARGLAALGHDVRLFTVGESTSPVPRSHLYPAAVRPMGDSLLEAAHVLAAYRELRDADVIHDHTVLGALIGRHVGGLPPIVVTHHGPYTPEAQRVFAEIARRARVVAISRSQARQARGVRIDDVILHGVDLVAHRPGPGDGGYAVFMGRMSPDKGVHRAVEIARRAGLPLRIVTKMWRPDERDYFERAVRPLLRPGDPRPGEEPPRRRVELLRHAVALLNPICWPEPFGLVMAEALACGTPVVGTPCGAAPEIVDHGLTGYLDDDDDALAGALRRVGGIDRRACRDAAERRFSADRMVADHLRLYGRAAGLVGTGERAA
ncbi:glycosyltransferase family 4 protein [Spirilliplanes yamanashiensis]|uniref:Glycosyl transferase n=1 Tax=Spirilliplanes yamanashiensis TaxID=42233 RepID=A0A8J3Y774_9ACTN|nr:glycosyltransferase family 4 protein [Spirilliplanes yamanashiensis]MDP9817269.1 glycosyltransferase involved in cell wall biosynthesis [Spirilliplanes yamanashiensis]GIJ03078.1 glycosyl transferase [Spirilliplanes yamanashiensis]